MNELIETLKADTTITRLLGSGKVYLNYTTDTSDCLIVEFHTVGGDRLKKHIRLKMTIVADTMEVCESMEDRLNEIILSFGDDPVNGDLLQSTINGGGVLYDGARHKIHKIIYYDIVARGVEQ